MKVRHNLPLLMAKKRIKSIKELERVMQKDLKKKYEYATLINFNTYVHRKIDPELVADLCQLFDCEIGELLFLEDERSVL